MSTEKGREGERIACEVLSTLGFKVVDKNFHSKYGEIDVIATKNHRMHFIEVKTTYGPYNPAQNFHRTKFKRFMKTVRIYCFTNNVPENMAHIDLALVDMENRVFNLVQDANIHFY